MPSKSPAQALADIRDAAISFVTGMSAENLARDMKTRYAVVRALEIISEASRRLPAELKARHPAIDWPAVAGAGNIYRHDYDAVDVEAVWQTIMRDLPPLRAVAESELRDLGL
jgi:uncharacterized protein with HEPN domain